MSTQRQEAHHWPAPLADRLPGDASAEQVAALIADIWLEIDAALHPIMGQRAVAALFDRSLKLTAASHPWLLLGHQTARAVVDPTELRARLGQQDATQAAAGGSAHFSAFHGLLTSLVGLSLTDRLLLAVWARSAAASTAQHPTP